MTGHRRAAVWRVGFLVLGLLLAQVWAQREPAPLPLAQPLSAADIATDNASGLAAERVADEAVRAWLARDEQNLMGLANLAPAEMCEELLTATQNPPPPRGTEVNFDDRVERAQEPAQTRVYTYPATVGETRLEVVEVRLAQEDGAWRAEWVGLRPSTAGPRLPDFFRDPAAGWVFVMVTALLAYLSFRPSFFGRWLRAGVAAIFEHRRLVALTAALLYGLFALGMLTGSALPDSCEEAFLGLIGSSLQTIGVHEVAQAGDVAGLAGAITYWNFSMGTLLTTFLPAYLLALPAYLLNAARFFTLGIPFGFNLDVAVLLLQAPVIVLELLAYILVTAGGGMFVVTLVRKGFAGYREGLGKLLLMLPLALLLLVAGAWYEAFLVLSF